MVMGYYSDVDAFGDEIGASGLGAFGAWLRDNLNDTYGTEPHALPSEQTLATLRNAAEYFANWNNLT